MNRCIAWLTAPACARARAEVLLALAHGFAAWASTHTEVSS